MRRRVNIFTAFFVAVILLLSFVYSVNSAGYITTKVCNDKNGVFILQYNTQKLTVSQLAPTKSSYSLSFDKKLKTSCVYNKTVYALVEDDTSRDVCFLYIIESTSSKKQLKLNDIKLPDSVMMSVDKSEIFIFSTPRERYRFITNREN